jgi:hypothetical protein
MQRRKLVPDRNYRCRLSSTGFVQSTCELVNYFRKCEENSLGLHSVGCLYSDWFCNKQADAMFEVFVAMKIQVVVLWILTIMLW